VEFRKLARPPATILVSVPRARPGQTRHFEQPHRRTVLDPLIAKREPSGPRLERSDRRNPAPLAPIPQTDQRHDGARSRRRPVAGADPCVSATLTADVPNCLSQKAATFSVFASLRPAQHRTRSGAGRSSPCETFRIPVPGLRLRPAGVPRSAYHDYPCMACPPACGLPASPPG
jgi:hypothetical protein